jgi:hypothetical protein
MDALEGMTRRVKGSDGNHDARRRRSTFETASRLTIELPWRQRAAWLALGVFVDLLGAAARARRRA